MMYIDLDGLNTTSDIGLPPPAPPMEREMQKGDVGSVVLLMFVLAFGVVIVDERWLRVLVAIVPALLLAQRAMSVPAQKEEDVGMADRRDDLDTRGAIDELLRLIREFYLTCHLMGAGKMDSEDAMEKVAAQEKDLNRLLARVTDWARGKGRPA